MLEVDISPVDKNHVQALRDEMSSLKKVSITLPMKEYFLKFKALKHSLVATEYGMSDERVIEYMLR